MKKNFLLALGIFTMSIFMTSGLASAHTPEADEFCDFLTLGNGDVRLTCPPNVLPIGVGQFANADFGTEKYKVTIGATEYAVFDEANLHAKVFESEVSNNVVDAFCSFQTFFPNRTLFNSGVLDYIPFSRGLYSKNFTVPNVTGVYPVDVECVRPITSNTSTAHFREDGLDNFVFRNSTGNISSSESITGIDTGERKCSLNRFGQSIIQYQDGEWKTMRFLQNVSNIVAYFSKDSGADKTYEMTFNFYKVTSGGEVFLGSGKNQTVLTTTAQPIYIPTTNIDSVWTINDIIEVEFCIENIDDGNGKTASFHFNGTSVDSRFNINGKEIDSPTDFVVGGSSELNVKLIGGGQTGNLNASITSGFADILSGINEHNQSNANEFFNLNISDNIFFGDLEALLISHDNNQTEINQTLNGRFDLVDSFLSQFLIYVENFFASLDLGLIGNTTATQNQITSTTTSLDQAISTNFTNTNVLIQNVNATQNANSNSVMDKIVSVNDTLKELGVNMTDINSTTYNKLIGLMMEHESLDQSLAGNFTQMSTEISSVNNTVLVHDSEVQALLIELGANVTSVNETVLAIDFDEIIENIQSVNSTVISSNSTVYNKLIALMMEHESLDSALSGNFTFTNGFISNTTTSLDLGIAGNSSAINSNVNSLGDEIGTNFTLVFGDLGTIQSNTDDIPTDVWTHPDRTLTALNITNISLTGNVSFVIADSSLEDIARRVYEFFFFAGVFDRENFETARDLSNENEEIFDIVGILGG